jgi:O-antigen/teichoic acid export membrane protein
VVKKYFKSDFFRNVATLSLGTALAQAIPILISPILTRLYNPHDFGELTLFTSLTALLCVVASLRYEIAILLPEKDEDAQLLARLSGKIAIVLVLALTLALPFWYLANNYHQTNSFHSLYWLAPVSVFLLAIGQIQSNWLSRKRNYKNMAASRFSQSAGNALVALGNGALGMGYWGLGIATVVGQLCTVLYSYRATGSSIYNRLFTTPFKVFKPIAARYQNFPRYNAPHAFIDSVTNNGINFFIDFLMGGVITGFYGFSFRILKAPSSLVSGAVYQVFYQKVVELHSKQQDIRPHVLKLFMQLFFLALVPFGILFVFGPDIFAFAFGSQWREAGQISAIIAPWLLMNFTISPAACLTSVKEKQQQALVLIIIDVVLKFTAFYLGYLFIKHPHGGFIAFSAVATAMQLYWMGWFYRLAGR